jgi:hypothetical protein
MTPRELLNAIRYRAYAMVFASGGKVSFEAAKKAATREVTSEERARKRVALSSATTHDGITVRNAKATLLAKLAEISKRLKATAGLEASAPTPQIRKHTLDPLLSKSRGDGTSGELARGSTPSAPNDLIPRTQGIINKPEPDTPPTEPVFIFGTTSTSERIPDSEYAPRFHDYVTDNWRKSIELNERIQREKQERSKWVG